MYIIRHFQKEDAFFVRQICMETAKEGHKNKEYVCWMFLDYYLESEPEHAFVLTADDVVVGYIVCSLNKDLYLKQMREVWIPKIKRKSWILGCFAALCLRTTRKLDAKYGGGFHMNITSKHQHLGLGKRMLDVLGGHLKTKGSNFLYLVTANRRTRGYGFYKHYGFIPAKRCAGGSIAMTYDLNNIKK